MTETVIIKECYHSCPFFRASTEGMYCSHPHFKNGETGWEAHIISQDNSHGRVPDECPLMIEPLQVEYKTYWKKEIMQ